MDATLTLLDLAGAVALLLWGVHMMQSGVQRAFGPNLRRVLGATLRHRLKAFAAGLGVTAVLQSSTATGLMTAGFAADGLIGLVPGLAIMLGANVGTTLIVQVLAFDISRVSPLFVLIGVMMFRLGGASRTRDLGRVAIGLGLMLMALSNLLQILTPYEDVPSLRLFLGLVATQPMIGLLVGALLTWAAHSSVAIVLLVMSFTTKGVIPLDAGLALVLGANIGSAINPVLEAPPGADRTGKQVAIGNLAMRCVGVIVVLPFVDSIGPWLLQLEPSLARSIANFHTLLNLVLALVFLPLLQPIARLLRICLPPRFEVPDPGRPIYLDPGARNMPAIALGCATREALRVADVLDEMLQGAVAALEQKDRQKIAETRRMNDVIDRLNRAIKAYLMELDPEALSDEDETRLAAILAFMTNLEHAGDTIDRSAMATAAKQLKRGVALSKENQKELMPVYERLRANLCTAGTTFMTGDIRAARALADEKVIFRDLEAKATEAYFQKFRGGTMAGAEADALYLDLLRDFKAVNDRLVAGAAYPLLQSRGELSASRLRDRPSSEPDADTFGDG